MKIGIIGSGGREHAISFALNKSNKVEKIFCFPEMQVLVKLLQMFP